MDDSATDTTPLVPAESQNASFKWYTYLLIVLFSLTIVSVFISSFASIWTFIFVNGTIILLAELFIKYIFPLKPDVVSYRFLITQAGLSFFVAPLVMIVFIIVIFIVIGIVDSILTSIVFLILFTIYPEAGKVFKADISALAEQAHSSPGFDSHTLDVTSSHISHISQRVVSNIPGTVSRVYRHAKGEYDPEQAAAMVSKAKGQFLQIWGDMVEAGASPIALGISIGLIALFAFVLFIIVGGLLSTGSLEFVKWKLFMRYKTVPGADAEAPASGLGVKGLAFIALSGALVVSSVGAFDTASSISHTFYSGLIFLCTSILDAIVIVGSQLLVASAFAEKEVLGKDVAMRNAFQTSILYNFGMGFLKVTPAMQHSPKIAPSVALFIILTAIRVFAAYKATTSFHQRYTAACSEQEETSA